MLAPSSIVRLAVAATVTALLAGCSATESTQAKGALVPLAGVYPYQGLTRADVVMTGAIFLNYAGRDSLSGEMLAADPQGTPYLDGHVLAIRQPDGSYLFEAPKAELEPTASRYVHRLRRTADGLTCELRDTRAGNTVTTTCALGAPGF